jgi:hypothetical protein
MNEPISGEKAAFPWPKDQSQHLFSLGMTIRDYFAAEALQGFCANQNWFPTTNEHFANLAEDSYKAADAMLKAKEAK